MSFQPFPYLNVSSFAIAGGMSVQGPAIMSTLVVTNQLLISTIPGQPVPPLNTAIISSLKVQTSTLNFVDTTNAASVLPLYNQGGSLYFNGTAVGSGGGSVGSNLSLSNLGVTNTISTISTFTTFLSASNITFPGFVRIAPESDLPIVIGKNAGNPNEDAGGIYIGNNAATGYHEDTDGQNIAIGAYAGIEQLGGCIAIGGLAGQSQTLGAIAIGIEAGKTAQGPNSIAIGCFAGQAQAQENTIILNASGSALNSSTLNSFYVKPIRNAITGNGLFYDSTSGEISFGNVPQIQSGVGTTDGSGTTIITFPTAFATAPAVYVSQAGGTVKAAILGVVTSTTTTTATVNSVDTSGAPYASVDFFWLAVA